MRTGALLAAIAGLVLLASGCGSSSQPSVANVPTTGAPAGNSTTTSTDNPRSRHESPAALASCLDAHGFSASVGSAASASGSEIHLAGVTVNGNVDPSSPQFQAAMRACRKYLPGGGPPAMTPAQKAEWVKAMTQFAACMRKDGVPSFPDPTGGGTFPSGFLRSIDPTSSQFQGALKGCQSLEPKFGPRIG